MNKPKPKCAARPTCSATDQLAATPAAAAAAGAVDAVRHHVVFVFARPAAFARVESESEANAEDGGERAIVVRMDAAWTRLTKSYAGKTVSFVRVHKVRLRAAGPTLPHATPSYAPHLPATLARYLGPLHSTLMARMTYGGNGKVGSVTERMLPSPKNSDAGLSRFGRCTTSTLSI